MGFFDKREFRKPAPPSRSTRPDWAGPPEGVLPGYSTQRAVLIKTSDAVVIAHRFEVYPTGFTFELQAHMRTGSHFYFPWDLEREGMTELPDEFMRLGMVFADGSSWSNLDAWRPTDAQEAPSLPHVRTTSGGGGDGQWHQGFWVWTLPPEGDLIFIVEWPSEGIQETSRTVNASELRQRAQEAEEIWSVP